MFKHVFVLNFCGTQGNMMQIMVFGAPSHRTSLKPAINLPWIQ